jgi:voltage-gated potassium channel
LLLAAVVLSSLLVIGTVGFIAIEGWEWFDALYMTVITLATVGFGEVHPLSRAGRWFAIGLILSGVFTVFYAAGAAFASMASGELGRFLRRRRMSRVLDELSNHVIVCGYGRMGRRVCAELSAMKVPFLVIERDAAAIAEFAIPFGVATLGDATDDALLTRAGITKARALVAVLASDADNLFITMSARLLADKLYILARAEDERSEAKLTRAGATRVVSPYAVTGYRVAHSVVRPAVVDFIEVVTGTQHLDLQMEEVRIGPSSPLVGQSLAGTRMRQELGVIVVAVKKASGTMLYNPSATDPFASDDVLIAVGKRADLERLERSAQGR